MTHADFIIIGGGVIGCATAYALTKMKAGRVILLERQRIAQAGSSQAAGLLTLAQSDTAVTQLIMETYHAVTRLEAELGEPLSLNQNGSLHAAISPENQILLRQQTAVLAELAVGFDWLSVKEAQQLVPWLDLPEEAAVLHVPESGFIDPYRLTQAYARAARLNGAFICEETAVLHLHRQGNRVTGVETARGPIAAPAVIDAAGVWASLLAWEIGCALPMAPVRSEYWLTAPDDLFAPTQPMVILPDAKAYTRPELGRLLVGLRGNSVAMHPKTLPDDVSGLAIGDARSWETLLASGSALNTFFPAFEQIGIAHYISGLSSYTPDGRFAFGPFPEVSGFFGAAACGNGIAASGGIGRALGELAVRGESSLEIRPFRLDRFGNIDPMDPAFLQECAAARSHKKTG